MPKNLPNIILIVMDAVRPDHLSCYGYRRKTSPNIDKLAEKGVIFENAFSTAEWSYPSHASIFTGKYPSYHKTLGKDILLHKENTTIAEILNWNGYRTIGVSSNNLLSPINGYSKGFQDYVVFDIHYVRKLRSISRFIRQYPINFLRTLIYGLDGFTFQNIETIKRFIRNSETPFFLFTNLYNCHSPYNPPRPFKKIFCPDFQRPPLAIQELLFYMMFTHPGGKLPGFDTRKLNILADDRGQYSFIAKDLEVSAAEWEIVKSWYDGEIRYLDNRIGELVDFLKRQGMFENTFWILCSDHGENFGDHNLASHQFCLYDSLLHIPLIIVYPESIPRGKRIANLVSTIDLFPTILDLVNIRGHQDEIQGKSLFPFNDRRIHDFICAESGESVRIILSPKFQSKLKTYDRGSKCLRSGEYKYIITADQMNELYNLKQDPLEKQNIAEIYPDKIQYFKKQLENTIDLSFFGPAKFPRQNRAEILKRLELMGYL